MDAICIDPGSDARQEFLRGIIYTVFYSDCQFAGAGGSFMWGGAAQSGLVQ